MAIQYYMRGYYTSGGHYVDWVVNDQPDSTGIFAPLSPLVNITVNRIVTSKVGNFLNPAAEPSFISPNYTNPVDGYFLHLNSYDWLNPSPGSLSTSLPPPNQPIGLAIVRGTSNGTTLNPYSALFWEEGSSQWNFYQINANGSLGNPQSVAMGNLLVNGELIVDGYEVIDGYLIVTNVSNNPSDPSVSQTGLIRLPNSQAITARNSTQNADIVVVSTDGYSGSNNVILGDPNHNVMIGGTAANVIGNPAPNTTTIAGNLLVLGNTTTVESTTVDIVGRVIHANWTTVPVSPPIQVAGYSVHRGAIGANQNDGAGIIWTEGSQVVTGADGYWKFASLLHDLDGYVPSAGLVNLLNVMGSSFSVASSPNPAPGSLASVGSFRTQNAVVAVSARNAAGTGNLFLVGTDGYDHITHGGTLNSGFIFNTKLGALYDLQVNSSSAVQIGSDSNGPFVRESASTFIPATSGFIRVPNNTTAVAARNSANNGNHMLIGNDGYDHIIIGTPANPNNAGVIFSTSAGNIFDFWVNGSSQVQIGQDSIIFTNTDGYALITQTATAVTSAVGANMTIAAQASNGSLGMGGNLILSSGFGSLVDGYVDLQAGGSTVAIIEPNKFVFAQGRRRNVTQITGTYTIQSTDDYIAIITLTSSFVISLPSFPFLGDTYDIKDATGNAISFPITINGNGHFIDGNTTYIMNQSFSAITLTWTGSSWSIN